MLIEEAEASQSLPRDARMGETSGKMKQFASWFTHGVTGGAKLRAAIYHAKTGVDVLAQVNAFFEAQLAGGIEPEAVGEPAEMPDGALVCD
jgi:tRNA-dihydrouridine synthase B